MLPGTTSFVLARLAADGRARTALVAGELVLELDDVAQTLGVPAPVTVQQLLAEWDRVLPLLAGLAPQAAAPLSGYTVLAPVEPRQVFQSGANYRTHVIDLAMAHVEIAEGRTVEEVRAQTAAEMDERAATGDPYVFLGLPSAVGGPFDDVVLPSWSQKHDWELELAAVIGAPAFRVGREQALSHVAGYTIVNDLSSRDRIFRRDMKEIGTDWFRGKNAPGFLPTGPWLVPASFVGDPQDLRITLTHNGVVQQDESTKDMLFDVAALVSAVSQTTTLLPGDLVLTGSPAGNGAPRGIFLRDGDVLEGSITGLGTQRQTYRAEQS
ncbi:hydrolase [Modestobacter sp. I12A-02628]|uniref:Fumarylacetoacetate hydrolase family protein n=1 Tax=Goekera deserti TaxID=2497753 RepID=A0A7K3WB95_9ACTN|nr:fumarylacetoacetate hydrolase family protein [Goekera deserti]MPQ99114.1 hydrolase [Goekera deserti]NDI47448.1 hydrolase [Goekera deserti]NEL53259.1 fumarylacetoacetate hydrolase family protein [Goekera deserti]